MDLYFYFKLWICIFLLFWSFYPFFSVFILNFLPVLSVYFRRFTYFFSFYFNVVDYIRLVFWSLFRYFHVITAVCLFAVWYTAGAEELCGYDNIEMWRKVVWECTHIFSSSEPRNFYNSYNSYRVGAVYWVSLRIVFHYPFPANNEESILGVCCVVLCRVMYVFYANFWNSWKIFTKFRKNLL